MSDQPVAKPPQDSTTQKDADKHPCLERFQTHDTSNQGIKAHAPDRAATVTSDNTYITTMKKELNKLYFWKENLINESRTCCTDIIRRVENAKNVRQTDGTILIF
jgi:hypothetical protein